VTPEDTTACEQRADRVHRLVQSLPPKYRDVILLFYFHDSDVSQTARSLRLPEGTVKARLSRARDILRSRLTGPNDPAEFGAPNAT
jgi:RNA polymerase sigma-70 factor, ECF subfamily